MGRMRRALRWLVRGRERGVRARLVRRVGCAKHRKQTDPVDRPKEAPVATPVDEPEGFHRLCSRDDLPAGEIAEFFVDEVPVALANVDGTFHAIGNVCPHAGGPLGDGELDGCEVACPWHGWTFDVTTGGCAFDPGSNVPVYQVLSRDDGVWVNVSQDSA